jgi:uncharacterized membrane protein
MADFTGTTRVSSSPDALFDYLGDVRNLPHYFARMTSAEPGDGDEVHTTARMPDGSETRGDAWFRVDEEARRIEWGSEGPSSYSGHLLVREVAGGSEVEVSVHTTRVEAGDAGAQGGIDETLAAIKAQAERAS